MHGFSSRVVKVGLGLLVVAVIAAAAVGTSGGTPKKQIQVALLFPGTEHDGSWANAWSDGAKQAAKKYKVKLTLVGSLNTPDQYLAQGAAFGSKGYNLVIMANGGVANADLQSARQFPKTTFIQAPFDFKNAAARKARGEPNNLGHVDAEQQQGTFFAGALAGLVTKTNKVASVNGFAFPALTRQPEAFQLGAECVNSKVKFSQKYINSWEDTALAKAAAQSFISGGADVLLSATDQAVQGMYAAAKAAPRKTYVIPSYFDSHKQAPTVVLTSVLYNLQGVAKDLIRRAAKTGFKAHFYRSYNYKNLGVGRLAPFYNLKSAVSASAQKELTRIKRAVISGKIRIPDETTGHPTIGTPGSAKKINVRSLGCRPVR
jgi:basic membrane protein A and related proteins